MDNKKFNIEKTEIIDSIAYEEETQKLIMLLADGMDWLDQKRHMFLLQEKLNTYLRYIDTKQYVDYLKRISINQIPSIKTIEIRITFLFKEPNICNQFIDRVIQVINDNFENVIIYIKQGTEESI